MCRSQSPKYYAWKSPCLVTPNTLDLIELSAEYSIAEIIAAPGAEDVIHEDNILVVIGKDQDISKLP